jgi:hypothetical protein
MDKHFLRGNTGSVVDHEQREILFQPDKLT